MARTIDQLAELSEELAVRRRFDLRNVAVVRWFFLFFLIVLLLLTNDAPGVIAGILAAGACSLVLLFVLFRRIEPRRTEPRDGRLDRLAGLISPHVRATILVYLVAQYLLLIVALYGTEEAIPWFMIYPILLLPFRFSPSEFILLHGTLVVATAVERWTSWAFEYTNESMAAFVIPVSLGTLSINAMVLGAALFLTRRFRREFLREWSAAREAYQERTRMRQELEFAREIQLSMLPTESPRLDWLDISSVSLPATEVGGDYYDFFPVDDRRIAVVVGDVAGHGLASGIVLSGVRSCLTLLADDLRDPVAVISRIHDMIRKTARHRMLVTLSILLLDSENEEAILTSAGHPPILRRRRDGVVDEIGIESLPLGAAMLDHFETRRFRLEKGDVLLLQTDGVYEMRDEAGELFGLDRLVDRLSIHVPERGSQSLRDAIIRDLWEFRGRAPQDDDLTILALTWNGPATRV
ncbi:MAG: PP2C family protein-serine/threonine phosphatase [Acidobacteria bacterium]|nr:PP2C family protein-serine/threonine phosphatase [Acidobacteriota bacterium]